MSFPRWLGLSFLTAIAAAFGACTEGSGAGGSSSTTSASFGGEGGVGGGTTTTTFVTTTSDTAPEAGPIVCKGMSTNVPKGDCDALQQDCPPGQSCRPVLAEGSYRTMCLPSAGLKSAGETCAVESECRDGLFCVLGKCSPVCCRDDNVPCAGGICDVSSKYGAYNMYFCHYAPTCDLLTPNACAEGTACHVEDVKQGLATCAEPSGANSHDLGPCEFLNDCPDMEQCYSPTATIQKVCRYYCWLDAPEGTPAGLGGCPEAQSCRSKSGTVGISFGVTGLGLCFLDTTVPDAGTDSGPHTDAGDSGASDSGPSDSGPSDDGGGADAGSGGTSGGSAGSGGTGGTAGAGGADAG